MPERRSWRRPIIGMALGVAMLAIASLWFGKPVTANALPSANAARTGSVSPGTKSSSGALAGYTLDKPALRVQLPPRLREVSGLTDISQTEVACVQDEEGIIFVYDLPRRSVTRRFRFGPAGDYEGLTHVAGTFYVLRSDGLMYQVDGLEEDSRISTHVLSTLPTDNEGLGWDFRHQRLLIAPKSRWGKGKQYKDVRPIFAFDPKRRASDSDPVMLIEVNAIRRFAEARRQPLPGKGKSGGLKFRPASIAIHPVTREAFVISGLDRVLAAFDERGSVTGYALLSSRDFPKPEGITFLPNGDLVIASEADGREPSLLVFEWKR